MSDDRSDTWHLPLRQDASGSEEKTTIQAYNLSQATASQRDALRGLAQQMGYKNLRGFANWLRAADLDYYDIIKVASP